MKRRKPELTIANEEIARRIADVMGSQSGHALALRELERQRASGRTAWLAYDGPTLLVFSEPLTPPR